AVLPGGRTALAPADFAAAYGVAPLQAAGLTGAGHSIAVIARRNFADGDVAMFSSKYLSFPLAPRKVLVSSDPGILTCPAGQPDCCAVCEQIEVLLDTEWAGSLAPDATLNVVIGSLSGDILEALIAAIENRASGEPSGDVITVSFGLCEQAATTVVTWELFDAFYALANGLGQIVGGTSAGTPALASALALVNQRLEQTHGVMGGLGQLLPDLYRLGSEQARGVGAPVFRDVVAGSNGAFGAGPGFDLASGW